MRYYMPFLKKHADVAFRPVIPVPEVKSCHTLRHGTCPACLTHQLIRRQTSNTAAAVLAERLNKPYSNAFIKNRYVHRTFIREPPS